MWNRVLTWLGSAPIADEVDRRNAPVMQLLLLFYGIALPANWAWHLSSRPIPKPSSACAQHGRHLSAVAAGR